jgi:hypothetical protein
MPQPAPILSALPTLAELCEQPSLAAQLSPDAAAHLLSQASANLVTMAIARDALLLRVTMAAEAAPVTNAPKDRTLDADEIAAALGQTRRWVFRNWRNLPFVRRVSRKSLAAAERDVLRWRASQRP